jgi:hypothetical protein
VMLRSLRGGKSIDGAADRATSNRKRSLGVALGIVWSPFRLTEVEVHALGQVRLLGNRKASVSARQPVG